MNYQFQFDAVFAAWPLLLKGTWITIQLSLIATVLGLVVAIFCAWGKTSGPGWLRFIINAYIEVIRNTPFLVQLFFFFFALPAIGLRWSPQTAPTPRKSSARASSRFPRARSRRAAR